MWRHWYFFVKFQARWNDESRVIDGDSMHDCVTSLKPQILEVVEKAREEEVSQRKAKKKEEDQKELEKAKRKAAEKAKETPVSEETAPKASSDNSDNVVGTSGEAASSNPAAGGNNFGEESDMATSTPNDTSFNEAVVSAASMASTAAADLAAAITSQLRSSTSRYVPSH